MAFGLRLLREGSMNDLAVIKPQADCFNPLQQWAEAGLVFYTESLSLEATAPLPSGVQFQTLTRDLEQQWKNLNGRTSRLIQTLNLSPPKPSFCYYRHDGDAAQNCLCHQ